MKLNWNNLHLLSREEICIGACVSLRLASKPWEEVEPWLRELLALSFGQRTLGRAAFTDGASGLSAPPAKRG